ncbi:hypothetical protein B0H11DRAFT_1943202 [Mycena galericulata]|nr:hypothetical protein B0H11DRAFT_1943202 [Mycena galericulata]
MDDTRNSNISDSKNRILAIELPRQRRVRRRVNARHCRVTAASMRVNAASVRVSAAAVTSDRFNRIDTGGPQNGSIEHSVIHNGVDILDKKQNKKYKEKEGLAGGDVGGDSATDFGWGRADGSRVGGGVRGSGFDSATQVTRALLIRVDGMGWTRSAGHTDGAGAHEAKGVPGTVVMRCLEGSEGQRTTLAGTDPATVTLAAAGGGRQMETVDCTARGEGPHEADATQRERRWEMERKGHRRPKCDAAQLECGGATDGGVRRSAMRIDAKRERGTKWEEERYEPTSKSRHR